MTMRVLHADLARPSTQRQDRRRKEERQETRARTLSYDLLRPPNLQTENTNQYLYGTTSIPPFPGPNNTQLNNDHPPHNPLRQANPRGPPPNVTLTGHHLLLPLTYSCPKANKVLLTLICECLHSQTLSTSWTDHSYTIKQGNSNLDI